MMLDSVRRFAWHMRAGGPRQAARYVKNLRHGPRWIPLIKRTDKGVEVSSWPWPDVLPSRQLKVAVIADDFTRSALQYEWDQVEITPQRWREQLSGVALLFVESAWHGNHDSWQYHLAGSSAPRPALVELVEYCREHKIPTVFWNKEDPAHYQDFLATAKLFDHVFTTDGACIDDYRKDLGHDRVDLLPFGVQPAIHHPLRITRQEPTGIAFAGTWFAHKFPERREQMHLLFGAAIEAATPTDPFEIFSRFEGVDERYRFPKPYDQHVVGSLSYDQMLSAYRLYKVFLNVNSVVDSSTMCARRVLEITACGTPVVSTPSPALRPFLGEGIAVVDSREEASQTLAELLEDEMARARLVHRGQREIWNRHTYSHRVDAVLEAVGLPSQLSSLPTVSVISATRRAHQLDHLIEQVARQADVELELLLGTHGFEPDEQTLARAADAGLTLRVFPQPQDRKLGAILNDLVDHAEGAVITKMDDDDLYLPHYLADALHWKRISGGDVVGKQARFVHLAGVNQTVLVTAHMEHRSSNFVAGPTLTMDRELAQEFRFPDVSTGEDTGFLAAVLRAGASIRGADRFNFVQMRNAAPGSHTWQVDEEYFSQGIRWDGLPLALVEL